MNAASSPDRRLHRSYLYAPGHRPDVMRKALAAGADCVLLDLEDAVPATEKAAARDAVADLLAECARSAPACDVHVRVNREADGWDLADVAAVIGPALSGLRLPKAEDPAAVADLSAHLDAVAGAAGIGLYPLVESARGVQAALAVLQASDRVVRACLGTADLLADLRIPGESPEATLHVRSRLVLDSRLAAVGPPIDSVHTDLGDADGLRRAAGWARGLGFFGKSVIHPRQVGDVHLAFAPSSAEVAHAERVLAAAGADGGGATTAGDHFVDPAVVARAEQTLRLQRTPCTPT